MQAQEGEAQGPPSFECRLWKRLLAPTFWLSFTHQGQPALAGSRSQGLDACPGLPWAPREALSWSRVSFGFWPWAPGLGGTWAPSWWLHSHARLCFETWVHGFPRKPPGKVGSQVGTPLPTQEHLLFGCGPFLKVFTRLATILLLFSVLVFVP